MATGHSAALWNDDCCHTMVQEGDRLGVLRAFGITWTPKAFLAAYTIGHDYTNKVNLLHLLHEQCERPGLEGWIYFDINACRWVCLKLCVLHFGDLHAAEIERWRIRGDMVFLMHLLELETAQPLLNVVARAKAMWFKKFIRRAVAQTLKSAGLVCKSLYRVMSCTGLRRRFCQRLTCELVQIRFGNCCLVPHVCDCRCETLWI